MDKKVIILNKNKGQTPLDCLNELKKQDKKLSNLPLTYAGRLDPLAEGLLLVLVGDECLKKDDYLNLSKEYEFWVLFGFSTDTYDLMGKITDEIEKSKEIDKNLSRKIESKLKNFIGQTKQPYPIYSSRTVKGKPLYKWAREGKIKEIEIPTKNVFIKEIKIIGENDILGSELLYRIKKDISLVKGDFRQNEILDIWDFMLKDKKNFKFKVLKFKIFCGSGVYVRSVANELGKLIGIPALALDIRRTQIGDYKLEN